MKHKTLAQKRTRKALARKHKQYTGPKYSKLDMMAQWAPLLSRAGIEMFADTGFTQKPQLTPRIINEPNTTTSFV